METIKQLINSGKTNFIFVGEAGSGKSEIALNFAYYLINNFDKPVHFFDMDMTKPLFRSRDLDEVIEKDGIICHYQEQFMDAPTLVGGARKLLKDDEAFVILDVGGDAIGARSIGGFSREINDEQSLVYYVINTFRPWSYDIDQIDKTLVGILGVSSIAYDQLHLINNPNVGSATTAEEFLEGCRLAEALVTPYLPIDFHCVQETLYEDVKTRVELETLPLKLYLTVPWL